MSLESLWSVSSEVSVRRMVVKGRQSTEGPRRAVDSSWAPLCDVLLCCVNSELVAE